MIIARKALQATGSTAAGEPRAGQGAVGEQPAPAIEIVGYAMGLQVLNSPAESENAAHAEGCAETPEEVTAVEGGAAEGGAAEGGAVEDSAVEEVATLLSDVGAPDIGARVGSTVREDVASEQSAHKMNSAPGHGAQEEGVRQYIR